MNTIRGATLRRRSLFAFARQRDEAGFTLVEMMMVLGTIAILVAVIMPTLVGARRVAQQRATQAILVHALQAANVAYVDVQDFATLTTPILAGVEPGLQFADGSSTSPHVVAVTEGTGTMGADPTPIGYVALAAPAGDGTCWYVLQTDDSTPFYGRGNVDGAGACSADGATVAAAATFTSFPL